MKLIIISNLFSGLNSILESKELTNKGSPFYYHFITYLNKYEDYQVFFLTTKANNQKKMINKIYLKDLNKEIILICGFDFLYNIKYGFTLNKLIQYILIMFSVNLFKSNNIPYIDRGNIIFSFILSIFNKKHAVRFLGISPEFSNLLNNKYGFFSKIIKRVFNDKNIIKILTKDGSYSEHFINYPNAHLMFNGINNIERQYNKKDKFTIMCIGRVEKVKGQRELLIAINKIKELDFTLNIIGDGSDMKYIKDYINLNKLENKVNIIGKIEHSLIEKYLLSADLFISINFLGMYSNALLEASKVAIPIIALDHNYFNDTNKEYFYLINNDDDISINLTEGIKKFYNSKDMQKEYSCKSHSSSSQLSDWDERTKLELKYIKEFINEN